ANDCEVLPGGVNVLVQVCFRVRGWVCRGDVESACQVQGRPTRPYHARTHDRYVANLFVLCHIVLLELCFVLIKYSSVETPICLRPPLSWRYQWIASLVPTRGDPRSTGNLAGQLRRSTPIAGRQLSGDSMSPETANGRQPTRATQRIHLLELCRFAAPQNPCPPRPCCPCQSSKTARARFCGRCV